jgi:hypothetical protein
MPGLDPGIHGVPQVRIVDYRANGDAWMPGSSSGMTKFRAKLLIFHNYAAAAH